MDQKKIVVLHCITVVWHLFTAAFAASFFFAPICIRPYGGRDSSVSDFLFYIYLLTTM